MKRDLPFTIVGMLCFQVVAFAQIRTITLANPSFEDIPRYSHVPNGWSDCGFVYESPPDVNPVIIFGVNLLAYDGDTYLGMVVRDNNTWEQVSQQLSESLLPDNCYTFSFHAVRILDFRGTSRITGKDVDFTTPVIIKIWSSNENCEKLELLAATEEIVNAAWQKQTLKLSPRQNCSHLLIEANYSPRRKQPYCGNVSIDFCELTLDCEKSKPKTEAKTTDSVLVDISIPLEMPQNINELSECLIKYGQLIRFIKQTTVLETTHFDWNGQHYSNNNAYLVFIAKAMQQFPNHRLIIAVDGTDEARYERVFRLQEALSKLGLNSDNYLVYPYNTLEMKKNWLWATMKNDLLMRIEQIKK